MVLYQPTEREISATLAAARTRFPYLGQRLERAAALLADVNAAFECEIDPWRIRSQTGSGAYLVNCPRGHSHCTCPDYESHANEQAPAYLCKHLLAYHGYRRILAVELNRRLVGDYNYTHERYQAQTTPGALLVFRDQEMRAVTYTQVNRFPRTVCRLRRTRDDALIPANDAEAAELAQWLTTAPPYTPPESYAAREYEADRDAYIDMQAERQPLMSQPEYRHWLATGEIPAVARTRF